MISSLHRVLQALLILSFAANATIVTTAIDEDDGFLGGGKGISLREAVNYSPPGDTITFDAAFSGQTIRLTEGQITVSKPIKIDGSVDIRSLQFPHITAPAISAAGHTILSFGIGAAAPGTRWLLSRSMDLLDFAEIYRFDGITDTAVPGISFLRTATGVTVTDTNPPPGGVFYRFEADLEP